MRSLLSVVALVLVSIPFWMSPDRGWSSPGPAGDQPAQTGDRPPRSERNPIQGRASENTSQTTGPSRDSGRGVPTVQMPDGSQLALLNGVTEAKPPRWPQGTPYVPPTGVYTSPDGTQWYVHGDVLVWTTAMRFRRDLGRMDAGTWTLKPEEARQIEPTRIRPIEGR